LFPILTPSIDSVRTCQQDMLALMGQEGYDPLHVLKKVESFLSQISRRAIWNMI
jgi:hypothetical protein